MEETFKSAKAASIILRTSPALLRSRVISDIARLIEENLNYIIDENRKDIENAAKVGLSAAMTDRLLLTPSRIESLAASVRDISSQQDPVGEVITGQTRPNGLKMVKIRVPMGIVGIIYESRPNVTIDCAALCLRSGNVALLRGGKEAAFSNTAFINIVRKALEQNGLPADCAVLLDDPDRSRMLKMIQAKGVVDLVIPRGGTGLIKFVSENAHVPVIKHDKGICHIYVDRFYEQEMALDIVYNAKVSRPSACNAVETLLVNVEIAKTFLPALKIRLQDVLLKGCPRTAEIIDVEPANEAWDTEFLDYTLNIRIVDSIDKALEHINIYSSGHSEAIITTGYENAEIFLDKVDSACVYVNASTRFTDGAEFGLGAEVGISTEKVHSRGPMGAFDLTTTKYKIYGGGQVR